MLAGRVSGRQVHMVTQRSVLSTYHLRGERVRHAPILPQHPHGRVTGEHTQVDESNR